MNSELIAYLKKVVDSRECYLLLDDKFCLLGENLLPQMLAKELSPGESFRTHLSDENLSLCEKLLHEKDSTEISGAVLRLSALSSFAYGYATVIPCFDREYLILYLFPSRRALQRSSVFSAPLAHLLSRISRCHTENAFTAFESAMESGVSSCAAPLCEAATSLFTTGAMLADFLHLSNVEELSLATFDLNELTAHILASAAHRHIFGDAVLSVEESEFSPAEELMPVQLSLHHFMKLVAACVSVMAYLSDERHIRISSQRCGEGTYVLRFTANTSATPSYIGHTTDPFHLARKIPDISLPLALADHIAALLGITLLLAPNEETGTFSLLLMIAETPPVTEEFKSRDQFASYEEALEEAVRVFFGKRLSS